MSMCNLDALAALTYDRARFRTPCALCAVAPIFLLSLLSVNGAAQDTEIEHDDAGTSQKGFRRGEEPPGDSVKTCGRSMRCGGRQKLDESLARSANGFHSFFFFLVETRADSRLSAFHI